MPESYISKISAASDERGNPYLLGLLDYYKVYGIKDITPEQAEYYYKNFVKGKKSYANSKIYRKST